MQSFQPHTGLDESKPRMESLASHDPLRPTPWKLLLRSTHPEEARGRAHTTLRLQKLEVQRQMNVDW